MRSTVFVCLAIGLFATVAAIDMGEKLSMVQSLQSNLCCLSLLSLPPAPLHAMESPSAIHGEYIVVLKEETTAKESEWNGKYGRG